MMGRIAMLGVNGCDNALCQKKRAIALTIFSTRCDRPFFFFNQVRSPFVVSDDRSPKMKERSLVNL
ncbi:MULTISPECIES: hypothetical protein [unclassified Microcoleus]|uniref:hypothetical protein n=1 Tax=unclassified Microcoleus TaxID=2642155 RepID=UPI0025DD6AD9|nr:MULTISPECIES: hypothetical protein [unclassified Microcoleus]